MIAIPRISLRAFAVWRRNFLVWKKLAIPSLLGNLADPMIYLFGLGYGLGGLLPQINGVSYIAFLAAGTVCASTMNAASFEALYSAFSRMHVQRTWEAIMNAPVTLEDVMAGELLWAAAKATLSGMAILLVIWILGLVASPLALWALPVIFLTGLAFAALGLIV
ncbi:MAG: ABC transporter permease, partial [Sulfuritalea sp.]|nr:ABC transporter permease [Sulfuritalea sp.]